MGARRKKQPEARRPVAVKLYTNPVDDEKMVWVLLSEGTLVQNSDDHMRRYQTVDTFMVKVPVELLRRIPMEWELDDESA
jgi:hypothetical protein